MRQGLKLMELYLCREIGVVIFILDLPEDYAGLSGWPVSDLEGNDGLRSRRVPVLAPVEINGIVAAEPVCRRARGSFGRQPLRISAAIPFRANIRPRAQDDVEAEAVDRHVEPVRQVAHVDLGKIIERRRRLLFVPVPRDV